MSVDLTGKKVAILATDGFEQSELSSPMDALKNAGAEVSIVSIKPGTIRGWREDRWEDDFEVDRLITDCSEKEFDALVLPGGVMNPDQLRMNKDAVKFVKDFFQSHKPVAAICHGTQILIDAEVCRGRKLTSYPSIRVDLINAGADWVDQEAVVDRGLVTSRSPKDLEAFNTCLLEEVSEGIHSGRRGSEKRAA